MTREELLKNYILRRYKSIRSFCLQADIPYSTMENLLKNGVMKSSVTIVLLICNYLNIDIEALIDGEIKEKRTPLKFLSDKETDLVLAYRSNSSMQFAVDKLLGLD